eukprot:10224488-Alexandrium_andersonii.AAC.1
MAAGAGVPVRMGAVQFQSRLLSQRRGPDGVAGPAPVAACIAQRAATHGQCTLLTTGGLSA